MIKLVREVYELHNTLNPKLFDLETNKLKLEVQQKLAEIAEEFLKDIDPLTLSVADIQFVGSNAGFNYNENSDIDLHLIVNFDLNYIDDEILQSIYNDKKNKFNDKYDFQIYGIPVEVYIENINSSNATNGIYSILRGDWVRFPVPVEYEIPNYSDALSKVRAKINEVLLSNDPKLIEDTINYIYMERKNGLALNGEISEGNLIFKELRNDGLLDGLRNKYYELMSDKLSLKEHFIVENYKDSSEYKELLSQFKEINKKLKELKDNKPEEKKVTDEEMRIATGCTEEDWKEFSRSEKEAMYDMFNDDEELNNYYRKVIDLEKEQSEIHNKIKELQQEEFENQGGNTYQFNMPKEFSKNSDDYFLLDTNEYHQDYLEDIDYAKSKGYTNVFIAEMTPDEYMDRCAKEIWRSPTEDAYDGMEEPENVHKYADKMKNGTKFDMPYLDLKTKSQEGRHRALAAKEAGAKTIPVLYLY